MKIVSIVGARPNFMKLASVHAAFVARGTAHEIVHTGQHYDAAMSHEIFDDLGLDPPAINLEIGSGRSDHQIARILDRLCPVLERLAPDWMIVYGDVTSTLGSALAGRTLGIRIAHVESGFRSFDRSMPEEINRILVDHACDLCLVTHTIARDQLLREGITADRIVLTGSTSLDLLQNEPASLRPPPAGVDVPPAEPFLLFTLHRQANVDHAERFRAILSSIGLLAARRRVIFPIHPRTRARMVELGITCPPGLDLRAPMRYREFLQYTRRAALLVTDSGGLQEEAGFLGIPAIILRDTTERPYLVEAGLCCLLGEDLDPLQREVDKLLAQPRPAPYRDDWTDGRAGRRVVEALLARP